MSAIIRDFHYSKATGRGRGILGLQEFNPCKKPVGCVQKLSSAATKEGVEQKEPQNVSSKVVVALYSYQSNKDSPGGFSELSVQKGQMLELLQEHPDNEHWWEVRNEDGDVGFVPSSYLIIKDEQVLPWLQPSILKSEEEERKERVRRLAQQKSALDGTGVGPAPKNAVSTLPAKICDKKLNGPKPYQAHMASKAHKEELSLLETS